MCAELVDGNISLDDLVIIKLEMEKNLKIGIVGAGIQGVCSALFIQKKGYDVTLFDNLFFVKIMHYKRLEYLLL